MAEAIEKVPAETRWEIATKGLTGACTAMMNALKGALSLEKFGEFQVGLWFQAEREQMNWLWKSKFLNQCLIDGGKNE